MANLRSRQYPDHESPLLQDITPQAQFEWGHLIASIALQIRQSLELSTILQTTADEVHRLLECDRVLLYRFEPDWSGQVVVESISNPQWSLLDRVVHDACFEACWLKPYQEGQFSVITDVATAGLSSCYTEFLNGFQVKANLVIPVLHKSQLWGLLIAHHCTASRQWQPEEIESLQQIAVQVGIALHQASLLEQLQKVKAELEAQVAARTTELEQTNQKLLQEVQERQQVAAEVSRREEFLRQVLNSLFTFVGVLTPDGILIEANQAPLDIAGLTREDVIGKPFAEAYWWSYSPEAPAQIRAAIYQANQGIPVRFDIPVQVQGGHRILIDFFLNPLRNATGQITYLIPSGIDITERKQAKTELCRHKDQLAQLAAIVESSQDAMISQSPDGIITSWNRAAEQLFGYTRQEMIGCAVSILIPLEYQTEEVLICQRIHQGERVETYQTKRRHQNGSLIDVALTISPIQDENGTVIGTSKILRDITERKQAEAALQASQARWQFALEGSGDGVWDWNVQTNEVFFSRQWKTMLGYGEAEIGNHLEEWSSRVHPDDIAQCYAGLNGHFNQETPVYQNEHRVRCKDGSYKWILDRGKVIEWTQAGQPLRMIGIHTDISERKQAEKSLNEQTATLSSFYNSSPFMMGIVELSDNDILHISDNFATAIFFHTTPEQLSDRWASELGVPPDHIQLWLTHYRASQEKQQPVRFEYIHQIPSVTYCLLVTVSFIGVAESQRPRFSYVAEDISDRKQAELELQRLSDRLTLALSSGAIGTWDWDLVNEAHWDERMYEIYGLQHLDRPAIYQDWTERVHPDDLPGTETALQAAIERKQDFDVEFRILRDDGEQRWVKASALVQHNAQGEPIRVIGTNYDITAHKQAELALKSAKDQLELVLQASSEGFWDFNLLTGEIYFSPQWKAMLGYADQELDNSLEMWASVIFEEDRVTTLQLIEDYNAGKVDHFTMTQRFHHKNGSTVYVLSRAIHLKDEQGNVVRMIGSHLDMTQLVEMQNALKTSEMQLSSVLNSSLDGIMAFHSIRDKQGNIIDFEWLLSNPTACELVGRTPEQLIGHRLLVEMPGNRDEGLFDQYVQVVESGEPSQRTFYYNHDGIENWFENISVKLGDGFAVTFRNVTAIKQSELALQQANQQLEERIEALNQRHAEMLILSEISDFLQACLTVEEACMALSSFMESLFPDCAGGIFLTTTSRNHVEMMSFWGQFLLSETNFHPQDCWALRRGRLHFVDSHRARLRCKHFLVDEQSAATLCIPMIAQGETLGLFYLYTETSAALPKTKQQLAYTVAEQVALAIANLNLWETLQQQSIRDPLTGLFNRRYLEEIFSQELIRSQRKQYTVGVIMLDIDHFKQFNDTYGHDGGDHILQMVGEVLKANIQGSDIACRYGGEEFALILLEASLGATIAKAEKIREVISQLKAFQNGHFMGNLTASLGVASFPQHGATGTAVLQAADAALYRAKAAGRNQVIVAP
jgi:diguanylate cyclase (GGDEF)-like protein/PAS domain S-box-containing protein